MRPIVHVGFHKTASSWFQRAVYPRVAGHRIVPRPLIRRVLVDGDTFGFDPAAARVALGVDRGEPAILCEEDLSGVLHNGTVSELIGKEVARRVHETLPDARIVIFVRGQQSAAISWYLQYLREGGTRSIRRYLFPDAYRHLGHDRPFKLPHFRFRQLAYIGLIEEYDRLYGRGNVLVLPFELLRRDPEAVFARMEAALGLTLPRATGATNVGYRRALVPLLRFANLFTARSVIDKYVLLHVPYWYTIRKALFRQLNHVPLFGPPAVAGGLLDRATRDWIAHRFWQSNRQLEQRIGVPLAPLGYATAPLPPLPRPVRHHALAWLRN